MTDVSIAITMVVVAVVLVAWFLRYKAGSSERRMKRMMQHYGLDPASASQGDVETIIREVRRRCRKCQFEGHCERWLAGKESGTSGFCPNARVFEELTRTVLAG